MYLMGMQCLFWWGVFFCKAEKFGKNYLFCEACKEGGRRRKYYISLRLWLSVGMIIMKGNSIYYLASLN